MIHELAYQNNFPYWVYNMDTDSMGSNQAFAVRHIGKGVILWVDSHVSQSTFLSYMLNAREKGARDFIEGR